MEGEELQQQLSRKVAQLTRVIFHLNVQLEENEAYTRAVSDAYEQEVEDIVLGVNQKLQQCLQQCEDQEQKRQLSTKAVESMLAELREAAERTRREAQEYRRVCDETLEKSQAQQALHVKDLEDQVWRYKGEVELCTQQLRSALKSITDNADEFCFLHRDETLEEDLRNQLSEKDMMDARAKCELTQALSSLFPLQRGTPPFTPVPGHHSVIYVLLGKLFNIFMEEWN